MDVRKLSCFLTIAASGSISKAAETLEYSQPALTQMMNGLENELGCHLLKRDFSGVVLTEEGKHLLPYIQSVVQAEEKLQQESSQMRDSQRRILRIGSYPSIMQSWLSPIIRDFQEFNPGITLELHVGGDELTSLLEGGKLDLAFLSEKKGKNCTWIPLMDDPFYAIVSQNSPLAEKNSVSLKQLISHPLILEETRELQPFLRGLPIQAKMQITATDDASRITLVEQGLGVAILPATSLSNCSSRIRILPLSPSIKRILGAAYSGKASKEVTAFLRFLQK